VGHDGVEVGGAGVAAFGEKADGVAAGEDAFEFVVFVDDEDGADAVLVHEAAGVLDGGSAVQGDWGAPDDFVHMTMGHDFLRGTDEYCHFVTEVALTCVKTAGARGD